jgi:phage tail-like protein
VEGCFFALEIPDFFTSAFQEASGIGSETEDQERTGVVLKVAGRVKWGNITLKRGLTPSLDVWTWRKGVEDGGLREARKSGSIVAYDQSHVEIARWNFENAWPSKVEYGGGQSCHAGHLCAWEALTLEVESLTRVR